MNLLHVATTLTDVALIASRIHIVATDQGLALVHFPGQRDLFLSLQIVLQANSTTEISTVHGMMSVCCNLIARWMVVTNRRGLAS
jgi:hypothetical protein